MKSICDICDYYPCSDNDAPKNVRCPKVVLGLVSTPVITNYDRLVSKTPEGLAKTICRFMADCYSCPGKKGCNWDLGDGLLKWFKAPVEVEE